VTDEPSRNAAPTFDTGVPHPARVYNAILGGKDNYAADRAAAEATIRAFPGNVQAARANRAFLARAVNFLTAEAGIRQFLDIGTGLPSADNTHEVAQAAAPGCRVVYVDNDPIVIVHARALLAGSGPVSVVPGDLRDPVGLLADPAVRDVLDFSRPMAVLLVAVLHFIRDQEGPERIVDQLKEAMPAGSYLAISHGTQDFSPQRAAAAVRGYDEASAPFVLRSREQVAGLLSGLDLVEPGLVQLPFWRPDGGDGGDPSKIWLYAGVGRKS